MHNKLSTMTELDPPPATGLIGLTNSVLGHDQKAQSKSPSASLGDLTHLTAQLRDLSAEVDRLRTERDRLAEIQARVLELLGTDQPDHLVHDLRNVLNERALFRALAETVM